MVHMMSAVRPPVRAGVSGCGAGVRPPAISVRRATKSSFFLRCSLNSSVKRVVWSTGVVIAAATNYAADSSAFAAVTSTSSSSKSAI